MDGPPIESPAPAGQSLEIEVDLDPCINLAMQQNAVPVVRLLRLHNRGDVPLADLSVRIRLDPAVGEA